MTLDLRFATLVQDLTVKALDLRMTVVVMIVLDLRLAAVIQDLHTALDLHQEFIIPLPQVLVRLEESQFFKRNTLNIRVNIRVSIQVSIQVNIQVNIRVNIPVDFATLSRLLLLLGVLPELDTNIHIVHLVIIVLVMTLQVDMIRGARRQLFLHLGIPLQLIKLLSSQDLADFLHQTPSLPTPNLKKLVKKLQFHWHRDAVLPMYCLVSVILCLDNCTAEWSKSTY